MAYDSAGRVSNVSGALNGVTKNYATGLTYAAHGGYASMTLGNGLNETFSYNNRAQISQLTAANPNRANTPYMQHTLGWGSTDNNGTLRSLTETNGGPGYASPLQFLETFQYDSLNRLNHMDDSGNFGRNYSYDQYGNMWVSGAYGGLNVLTPQTDIYSPANNKVNQGMYDLAGNQLAVAGNTLSYDAENHVSQAAQSGWSVSYVYDAEGHRVVKMASSGLWTVYVYDAFGQIIATYNSQAQPKPTCTTCYLTWDHLGSTRLVTDQSGNIMSRHDYEPFGVEVWQGTGGRDSSFQNGDGVIERYTGQQRDEDTMLDFFNARYFSAPFGRFSSTDPMNAGADASDPQTWNGYAYVRNNPMNLFDPSGLDPIKFSVTGYCGAGCFGLDGGFSWGDGSLSWGDGPRRPQVLLGTGTGGGGVRGRSCMGADGHYTNCLSSSSSAPPTNVSAYKVSVTGFLLPPKTGNIFSCASEFAAKYSIAGGLQRFGIGTSGVGGFITNALGGNAFSGATDLIQSFVSGEAGRHNVFYNMGQGVAAGPTQGFGAVFGERIKGTPWGSGPVDVATEALVARGFSVATGAGQTIQTLNGVARLGSLGLDVGEVATGAGTLKLIYDAASYGVGLVHCY